MSLLSRLERRFGRFAIPHLTSVLIAGQAALYVANLATHGIAINRLALDPAKVLHGEVWRLVTFLFTPPAVGPLFVIFYFLLLHMFGYSLENYWGTFRYNIYLLIGYIANVAAAFAASAIVGAELAGAARDGVELAPAVAWNGFLYASIFLAFARLFPDFTLNIFYVLPIRIKWLALLMWIGFAMALIDGGTMTQMLVLATTANYLLFFGREHWHAFKHDRRRISFQVAAKKSLSPARHVCLVCGANSADSPRTLFRYCSKCAGQACYCPDHIRDHEHITTETPANT
jgi:hypothetical protein